MNFVVNKAVQTSSIQDSKLKVSNFELAGEASSDLP